MAQCNHCYGDDRNSRKAQFENSGYCIACVSMHPSIRQAAIDAIEGRKREAAEREVRLASHQRVSILVEMFEHDAAKAVSLAIGLVDGEKRAFIERAEKMMHRERHTLYTGINKTGDTRPEFLAMQTWLPCVKVSAGITALCASLDTREAIHSGGA